MEAHTAPASSGEKFQYCDFKERANAKHKGEICRINACGRWHVYQYTEVELISLDTAALTHYWSCPIHPYPCGGWYERRRRKPKDKKMNQPGLGAMLHILSGGSKNNPEKYYGKKIKEASFSSDRMTLTFDDGVSISISDKAQSCCENRYMSCDDDVSALAGKRLHRIEVKKVEDTRSEYSCHEVAFLEIHAEDVIISFSTHNEHNGYYGGFGLSIDEAGKGE